MDYRDPLFSVIMFFLIVLIGVIVTLIAGKIRENYREKKLNEFLKGFEYIQIDNLKLDEASIEALYLLANAYEKVGDFEKALKIYLLINKTLKSIEILKRIAKLYYKAGFLEKAKHIIYQVLSTKPRDVESLKLLVLIDEKLNDIKEIKDILDIFEELEIDFKKEKAYLLFKTSKNYEEVYKKYPFIKREYLKRLFLENVKKAYEEILENEIYDYIDLYWNRKDIPKEKKFYPILKAKKEIELNINLPFELEVLANLKKEIATLEFEYICNKCKKVFPLDFVRCPNCNSLFNVKVIWNLTKRHTYKPGSV